MSTTHDDADPAGSRRSRGDPIAELAGAVVEVSGIAAGDRVLDVAAGSGCAAVLAAQTGAHVVATELSPPLLAAGRRTASDRGLDLLWVEADTAALPFADGDFDAVVSVLGVTLAPHPQQTVDELARVCRSGGVIALAACRPPAPAGWSRTLDAQPNPLWGSQDDIRALFGRRVSDLRICPAGTRVGLCRYLLHRHPEGGPTVFRNMIDWRSAPSAVGRTPAIAGSHTGTAPCDGARASTEMAVRRPTAHARHRRTST